MSKKYLDTVGLNKLVANILSKFAAKNHSHSNATTNSAGFMSSSDKVKLDGVAAGANKTIVDSSLNGTSTNPIQNKAVKTALDGKAASSHVHPTAQITGLDAALAGKASASHTHSADNITSGVLPIARGGTGAADRAGALYNIVTGETVGASTDWNSITRGYHMVAQVTDFTADKHAPVGMYTYGNMLSMDRFQIYVAHNGGIAHRQYWNDTWTKWITSFDEKSVIPIVNGGTGATSARAAQYNLFHNIDEVASVPTDDYYVTGTYLNSGNTTNGVLYKMKFKNVWSYIKSKTDPLYQPKGSYAASSHTHSISNITNLQSQLDSKQPKGSYAASSHTHTISNVTNLQTELDKKQVKTQPVTTAGTGSAYTATVPHIKSLTAGMKFTMIPHVASAAVSPTLDVNGLGAKPIRQRLSNGTASTATGATDNWLAAGKPVEVMYDSQFWVVDFVRPNMASAYGALPVENGGVPSCTTSDNGKFLRVVNGVAAWSAIASAENASF